MCRSTFSEKSCIEKQWNECKFQVEESSYAVPKKMIIKVSVHWVSLNGVHWLFDMSSFSRALITSQTAEQRETGSEEAEAVQLDNFWNVMEK